MQYKRAKKPLRAIGQELDVDARVDSAVLMTLLLRRGGGESQEREEQQGQSGRPPHGQPDR